MKNQLETKEQEKISQEEFLRNYGKRVLKGDIPSWEETMESLKKIAIKHSTLSPKNFRPLCYDILETIYIKSEIK